MNKKKNIPSKQSKSGISQKKLDAFFITASLFLIVITSVIYYQSLNNKLTNWDDQSYIANNQDIKLLQQKGFETALKKSFTGYVMGNYHPLTMLSYCLDDDGTSENIKTFHTTNLIIHLLNTVLVFYFIWLLTKQKWTAFITSLLFSIHPMHVESVAWVSERKDVLYAFFYLAALCLYLRYLQKEKYKTGWYVLTLFLFVCAVLSKAMAVSLPVLLIVLDYFVNRKITYKTVLEKIPFFIIALVFGLVAIQAQKSGSALNLNYPFAERILLGFYALLTYLWKFILPVKLTCFYPYPEKENGLFPTVVYLAPLIILGISFFIYKSLKSGKEVLFGFIFFIITIILVIQIIPVGDVIIADRYTYLPYIGLSFIVARFINQQLESTFPKENTIKTISLSVLIMAVSAFSYLAYQRTKVWQNSITLWSAAIENNKNCFVCYKCRGDAFGDMDEHYKAIEDYNEAAKLKKDDPNLYYNRAGSNKKINNYTEALNDYNKALQYNPKFSNAYFNKGNLNQRLKKYNQAIMDYSLAIQYQPDYLEAYFNRAIVYDILKKYDGAIADYTFVINANQGFVVDSYCNRGNAYLMIKQYNNAINDYTKAIGINENFGSAYFNRGLTYYNMNNFKAALADFMNAKQKGYAVNDNLIKEMQAKI